MTFEVQVLVATATLIICILISTWLLKARVPLIIAFLAVGVVAGELGAGAILGLGAAKVQTIGIVALVLILFDGGFESDWSELRPILTKGATLATVGFLLNTILLAVIAHGLFGFSWSLSLLIGSGLGCTDAAAIFGAIRSKGLSFKNGLAPIVEFESASNDPVAVFLAFTFIAMSRDSGAAISSHIPKFVLEMGVGAVVGIGSGYVARYLFKLLRSAPEGFYPGFSLAWVFLTYAVVVLIGGSGYLAVYVAGLTLCVQSFPSKERLLHYHHHLGWLMQLVMFLSFGIELNIHDVASAWLPALGIGLASIFVARPIAVVLTLSPFRIPVRERLMVSWMGLRGSVSIILAATILASGITGAQKIGGIVVGAVILSLIIQGSTIEPVARLLGISSTNEV